MILGIGNDLCDIRRIEKVLDRHGERFLDRCFTPAERALADSRGRQRAASYAKRWAAKEACAKALGTGFADGVFLRDVEVVSGPGGKPDLVLTGGAAQRLGALVPAGMEARVHLAMTDEYPLAQAMVVLSAVPAVLQP